MLEDIYLNYRRHIILWLFGEGVCKYYISNRVKVEGVDQDNLTVIGIFQSKLCLILFYFDFTDGYFNFMLTN